MNLKELSNVLGLSQTTVSRALNDYPEVSEKTRRIVKDAAAEYSYRPNVRAMSLATGRTLSIGHIIPISTRHEIVNPVFADFIAGAGEIYARNNYDMKLSVVADKDQDGAYRDLAARHDVDGVIVHGPRPNDTRIDLLNDMGMPFVVHGRTGTNDDAYSWVDVDNRSAFRRAADLLLDLGHTRIALINGLEQVAFAQRRRQGYEDALAARRLAVDEAIMTTGEMNEYYGFESAERLLKSDNAPTAFLVSSMIAAIGVRRAINARDLKIPRDVSVVIFDDELSYMHNGRDVPIFTATRSSVGTAGRLCAQMLLDIIREPGQPPKHRRLEAELMVGMSTGPMITQG